MKWIYILLFSLVFVSSGSAAKIESNDIKHKESKQKNSPKKSAKINSSKLIDYKVKSGDTLFSIARKHHTTVAKITLINGMKKGENLKIGRSLRVPLDTSDSASNNKSNNISLASVMQEIEKEKKNVHAEKKIKAKKIAASTKISNKKPSIKTKVSKKKTDKKAFSHTVKKGDTLYAIAKNNHTTVSALEKFNHIKPGKSLKLGQVISLPKIPDTPKSKAKIAKTNTKTKKKTTLKIKVAKSDAKVKKKTTSSKKSSQRKLVLEPKQTKKSFFASLKSGSNSALKLTSAKKQLGKRYVWGAVGPYTFDCSGFTSYVCKKNGVCLPRTSINQSKVGKRVNRNNLKAGDLVFFDTSKRRRGYINHVGIYMGNNKFIHASSAKKKVVISSLEKPFYKARFKWGSRVKG